ncbi:MAG: ParB/RepB/Spo0J family partition protein [Pseudomonadota bacterium]
MSDKKRKKGLGRGLSALLDTTAPTSAQATAANAQSSPSGMKTVSIELIKPNPDQPRRTFPPAEMRDLANSLEEKGVLQPLLVRPDPDDPTCFSLIAGERRWRAAQMAKLHEIPVIVRDLSDDETLEIAIIENVQRADLNPVEEALGYQQLIDRFGHSQAALAKVIGKSRPYIANALRLLTLPDYVKDLLANGRLTAGHARALVTATDPAALARKIVDEGLTVRQAESLAKQIASPKTGSTASSSPAKDADTRALEGDLSAAIGAKVAITHREAGGGEVTIRYKSLDELDGICRLLMQ